MKWFEKIETRKVIAKSRQKLPKQQWKCHIGKSFFNFPELSNGNSNKTSNLGKCKMHFLQGRPHDVDCQSNWENKVYLITLNWDFLSLILLIIWIVLLKIAKEKQEAFKYF